MIAVLLASAAGLASIAMGQRLDRQDGASFGVSADGRLVAFTSGQVPHNGLFLLDRKTGATKEITRKGGFHFYPAFSPNGKTLAFSFGASGTDIHQILLTDIASGKVENLYLNGALSEEASAFSPDGKWIAFDVAARRRDYAFGGKTLDNYDLYIKALPSGKVVKLTSVSAFQMSEPCWSPDGKHLMVAYQDPYPASTASLVLIDAKSHKVVKHLTVSNLVWTPRFFQGRVFAEYNYGHLGILDLTSGKLTPAGYKGSVDRIQSPVRSDALFLQSPTGRTLRYTVFEFKPATGTANVVLKEVDFDRKPSK